MDISGTCTYVRNMCTISARDNQLSEQTEGNEVNTLGSLPDRLLHVGILTVQLQIQTGKLHDPG